MTVSTCTEQANYPSSYGNPQALYKYCRSIVFQDFTATFLGVAYPTQVRAAAKISAGGWVAPSTNFYGKIFHSQALEQANLFSRATRA